LQVQDVKDGLIRYIKAGGKIESHDSSRPSQTWLGFMDHILRGAFLGMDWPIEVAWNMATLGGASVRAVVNQAKRSISARQCILERLALNSLLHPVSHWIEEGSLPIVDDWYNWGFTKPAQFSVDVGRDRQNARDDIATGLMTMSGSVSENGDDPMEFMTTRGMDKLNSIIVAAKMNEKLPKELIGKYEIKPEDIYNPLAPFQQGQIQQDQQDQEDSQDPEDPKPPQKQSGGDE